ncbi:rhomboid family intramembrane serine protease [Geotalea toluenoxydans]|uniref:rhomboid family intramembrane serine protease n=1 Tax=Geotalea toluenoxydans TaxID=421624 RepID=UPI0006D0E960|nr:rhomboid family intramembrane serine protease [Geotalea toluenoxydans]
MEREAEQSEWLSIPAELGVWRENSPLSERRVRLWALVLEARGIPFRTEKSEDGWLILVPDDFLIAARDELRLFEKENHAWPPHISLTPPLKENALSTLSVLILLATFHNITRLDIAIANHASVSWQALGSGNAARILSGEWWRLVTALTLHTDAAHLLGNLAIGGIFTIWLCRQLGSGLAWSLILLSGILGNLTNVYLNQPQHSSIGASTAVFGAVGVLAAVNMLHHPHALQGRRILPVAAALSLLAILGTEGKNTDLGAHLFGFISGIALGFITGLSTARFGQPQKFLNAFLAVTSAAVVLGAWWLALFAR